MSTASASSLTLSAAEPRAASKTVPWLGIVAVLLGVTTSVMVGQMISIGLADLRGALHLSVDQGAWLGPVYNAGQMFTGPLTVYLGGMFGPRRVLLIAAPMAAVCALSAPLMPGYASLLAVVGLLGFACGSFYPLTLSFVARNLPPKLVFYGISAYVFDVIGSLHLASILEGATIQYLSWRWLFWGSIFLTGPMWYFVHRGMPGTPMASLDTKKLRPTWAGFLYTSLGFSTLFLLLTQGDRLDWWRSAVEVALLVCGCFLLLAGWVRHLVRPNPMVQLGSLFTRNVVLLSICLCVLRFSLLSSALIVPQFLGTIGGLRPLQYGAVLAWVSVPVFLCALAASLSLAKVDPRIFLGAGFGVMCVSCYLGMQLSSRWSRTNFLAGELLLGLGAAVAVCGLVGCIVLQLINSGAAKDPVRTLTFVAWFHTVRLFGGQIMTTVLSHLITVREHFHWNVLGQSVSQGNFTVQQQLDGMAQALAHAGSGAIAMARSASFLSLRVQAQAMTLSLQDAYAVEALVLAGSLIAVVLIRQAPVQFSDLLELEERHG